MDAFSIAAAGMISAGNRFSASAGRAASGQGDSAAAAVEQVADKQVFEASAAVAKAADEMTRRVLDIKV